MTRDELNAKYCLDEMGRVQAINVLAGKEPGDKKAAEKIMNYWDSEWLVSFKAAGRPWVERVIHCKNEHEAIKKATAQVVSNGISRKYDLDVSKPVKVEYKKNWVVNPIPNRKGK